ncbi:MAG: metal-dependent hydrolase [Microthrixaceae bacterium]
MARLRTRTPTLCFESVRPDWHPRLPEFAAAANAVSLMMPYVEPFVVRAVRSELSALDGELAEQARRYAEQESRHHTQHRHFNERLSGTVRGVGVLTRAMEWTFRGLSRWGSPRFHMAYSTASEALAYGLARWVERHHHELFDGADPDAARLYLWHLAEEVEHKQVAVDVYDERYGSRAALMCALAFTTVLLALFATAGTVVGLVHLGRRVRPSMLWNLCRWGTGFVFTELPNMFVALLPGHRPADFVDPTWYAVFLAGLEAAPVRGAVPTP